MQRGVPCVTIPCRVELVQPLLCECDQIRVVPFLVGPTENWYTRTDWKQFLAI